MPDAGPKAGPDAGPTAGPTAGRAPVRPTAAPRPVGPARVLVLAYGFFALAAGARSAVQLATDPGRAPLAYALSAVAALTYLLAAFLLRLCESEAVYRPVALAVCAVELAGVAGVGAASLIVPRLFLDATVWSHFGSGYGYVPALLPLLALLWLWRRSGVA